ncbi:hypothetical protein AKO1_006788 [Acrasis kona]|uniref:Ubiquitin-like domain-containing protein n=1 Tax=Acrasis kona TaxID=1008807 RepID=A0AAW2YU00_9EUKA
MSPLTSPSQTITHEQYENYKRYTKTAAAFGKKVPFNHSNMNFFSYMERGSFGTSHDDFFARAAPEPHYYNAEEELVQLNTKSINNITLPPLSSITQPDFHSLRIDLDGQEKMPNSKVVLEEPEQYIKVILCERHHRPNNPISVLFKAVTLDQSTIISNGNLITSTNSNSLPSFSQILDPSPHKHSSSTLKINPRYNFIPFCESEEQKIKAELHMRHPEEPDFTAIYNKNISSFHPSRTPTSIKKHTENLKAAGVPLEKLNSFVVAPDTVYVGPDAAGAKEIPEKKKKTPNGKKISAKPSNKRRKEATDDVDEIERPKKKTNTSIQATTPSNKRARSSSVSQPSSKKARVEEVEGNVLFRALNLFSEAEEQRSQNEDKPERPEEESRQMVSVLLGLSQSPPPLDNSLIANQSSLKEGEEDISCSLVMDENENCRKTGVYELEPSTVTISNKTTIKSLQEYLKNKLELRASIQLEITIFDEVLDPSLRLESISSFYSLGSNGLKLTYRSKAKVEV